MPSRRTWRQTPGINGVSTNPFDWGLPTLAFSDLRRACRIPSPQSLARPNVYLYADNLVWNHGKHTWRWGGDFRRIQQNTEGEQQRARFVYLHWSQYVAAPGGSNGTLSAAMTSRIFFSDFRLLTSVQYRGRTIITSGGYSWILIRAG